MQFENKFRAEISRREFGSAAFALIGLITPTRWTSPVGQRREQRFEFKGTVKSVDRPNRSATIKHEKVGDYMEAMTMPFLIKDPPTLKQMQPGDRINAMLVVTDDGRQWLENVVITAKAAARNAAGMPGGWS